MESLIQEAEKIIKGDSSKEIHSEPSEKKEELKKPKKQAKLAKSKKKIRKK